MLKNLNNKYIHYFLYILCILIPLIIEKFIFPNEGISIDRYIIFTSIFLFCIINLLYDRKKIWNFIYQKRYILGIIIFSYCVINGYHGSSISMYNNVIQQSSYVKDSNPFLFQARVIRGDEWSITTPSILSQKAEINNLSTINKTIMGSENSVTLYPRLPVKSITILSNPQFLPFLFLDSEHAFSMYWNLCYFVMFFATFELFMLITKQNKKYSLIGAIMVTLAPATQWWEAYNIITFGALAILMFNKYLECNKTRKKILYSILCGLFGSCYIMCMYPAWQITYGYFFLILVIWQLVEHKKEINVKNISLFVFVLLIVCVSLIVPSFINSMDVLNLVNNTVYPGARFSTGGTNWQWQFNYITSIFTPFIEHANASEASQFISLYPLPLLVGIYNIAKNIKNKNKDLLLLLLVICTIFLNVWNYVELPNFLAKITLLYMSTPIRSQITVGFLNIILLIYCLAIYEKKKTNKKEIIISHILSIGVFIFGLYEVDKLYNTYFTKWMCFVSMFILVPIMILFLINNKKYNNYLILGLSFLSIVCGFTVHPLTKGLSILYEKPLAIEIQNIVSDDPDGKWMTIGTVYYFQNYLLANGAKTINSTNYYPNYNLWDILDKDRKYEAIYNRYAHMNVNIIEEKTNIEFLYEDAFILNINKYDLCEINAKYLVTNGLNLSAYDDKKILFEEIYNYDGSMIYKLNCHLK